MVAVLDWDAWSWSLGYVLCFVVCVTCLSANMTPLLVFLVGSNGSVESLVAVCENIPITEKSVQYHRHLLFYIRQLDLDIRVCGLTLRPKTAWLYPVGCAAFALGTRSLF